MKKIVSAEEMRWCDATTIGQYAIPGMVLMENAGRGVVEYLRNKYPQLQNAHLLILCGKGNNGGDGFVIARHLLATGAMVTVVLMVAPAKLTGDALLNYSILKKLQTACPENLSLLRYHPGLVQSLQHPDILVDALFGTGFSGVVKAPFDSVINWINAQSCPVVSVDIPSGVDGTSGMVGSVAVRATATITMGLLKTGLICNQARDLTGEIHVVDIGLPGKVASAQRLRTEYVCTVDLRPLLPHRPSTANKYSVGKVLVLAGAKGYTGAAALCVNAALRTGAGAVLLGTPESIYPILARKLTEAIIVPLPSTPDGSLSLKSWETIAEKLAWSDVLVLGPGLSRNEETRQLICQIITSWNGKIVVDADALFALSVLGKRKLKTVKSQLILTPHSGEFGNLVGLPAKEIDQQRIESCRSFAQATHTTLVLKGAPSVTGTGDGKVFVNSTGNPGMATVGSGDVLAGIIGSLWAQGMENSEAAYSGVLLHGLAGDRSKAAFGERSIVAQDLVDFLPEAIQMVECGDAV